jgi:mono/diheme cytochrome c family protein
MTKLQIQVRGARSLATLVATSVLLGTMAVGCAGAESDPISGQGQTVTPNSIDRGGGAQPGGGALGGSVDGGTGLAAPINCSDPSMTTSRGLPPGVGFQPQIPTTIAHASTPSPPLSGGTLLALADGETAVASDPERDQVDVIELVGNSLRSVVALQPGDEPGRLVQDALGRVHVALRRGGAIVTIDPVTGNVLERRTVCSAPRGVAYDAALDLVHVACAGGELVSLPAAGGAATRTLTLERDLRDVVVGAAGTLLVSTFRHANVLVVAADGSVQQRLVPTSGLAPVSFDGPRHVSPAVAWRMVPRGDAAGSVVMLHQMGVDDMIAPAAGSYGGLMGCGSIVSAAVSTLTPGSTVIPTVPGNMMMVSLAVDLAVSPDGTQLAIAVPGNASSQGPTVVVNQIDAVTTGSAGSCVNMSPIGGTPPPGQVVAVSFLASGVLLAQTREPATLWRSDTSAAIALATDSRLDTGHLIFHVNAGGGLACASCHPEGGEDGRVWNFACLGARRTQSIRGNISATAPFHWDGAEQDFSHLMDDVFSGRMSGPMLADDQKQALEDWVDTIKLLPPTPGLDTAAVARGGALFNDATIACATCHAGSLLTNNATVNVGTGGMFQVPSLRGVAWRAPFMHTGCGATLADRFSPSCGGGDMHGKTSQLAPTQIADLVTYLESL